MIRGNLYVTLDEVTCKFLFLWERCRLGTVKRNISIKQDENDNRIVVIHGIRFTGKRNIDWKCVKEYLKQYIGEIYEIADSQDVVYIGNDLPDEFSGSEDTARLKAALAKAKANMAQGIPQMIEIAQNRRYQENLAPKHSTDARYGWYRYTSRFALPIYSEGGEVERYNIFRGEMLIRHDADGKKYLYDVVNIKKETSTPLEH